MQGLVLILKIFKLFSQKNVVNWTGKGGKENVNQYDHLVFRPLPKKLTFRRFLVKIKKLIELQQKCRNKHLTSQKKSFQI